MSEVAYVPDEGDIIRKLAYWLVVEHVVAIGIHVNPGDELSKLLAPHREAEPRCSVCTLVKQYEDYGV